MSFRGMPLARWWAFESSTMNLSAVRPERREIAKLIVIDFMLVHGNDWYVVPFRQPFGTLSRVESLVVHDVFGGMTLIERTDRRAAADGHRWTMFSTSVPGGAEIADLFLLAPTAGAAAQSSGALEEVRFVRDEMANLAWGIEHVVPSSLGEPWPAHERSLKGRRDEAPPPPAAERERSLRFGIQTTVPEHWIPFLPVVVDPSRRDIQLERGLLLPSETTAPAEPAGRIRRPPRLAQAPYRMREEELPRTGLRVVRLIKRSRWVDGSTRVWVSRRKTLAAHEERSGLLFDLAVPA